MPTFREVKINIESRIEELDSSGLTIGEPELTRTEAEGYFRFGEDAALTYVESGEGGEVRSEIEISGDTVTVKRSGAIVSTLVFREGEEFSSVYSIPPYSFDVKVQTKRVRTELRSEGGVIDVLYGMSIGGAGKAVRMKIWIRAN